MSYELLLVPEGYRTDLALIVAPYVDSYFIEMVVKRMNPKRLCLVVDDGVRSEDLQKIQRGRRKGVKLEVRLASSSGLMHMKAFYFEFVRMQAPMRKKRRLFFGSANATNAAFDGRINAELLAAVDLKINDDSDVAEYFSDILSTFNNQGLKDGHTTRQVCAAELGFSQSPTLYFPRFKSVMLGEMPSGFDSWLQRGVLAAQFRNAPQFAILNIYLKKALPQDVIARIFANRSFTEKGERNLVRYGYLSDGAIPSVEELDEEVPQWKARYGVWTHLGDWISQECFRSQNKNMKSKSAKSRGIKILRILKGAKVISWRKERLDALLKDLAQVWDDLKIANVKPGDYLEGKNGKLNPVIYEQRFPQKLDLDFHLAQDDEFERRYVQGYEFPRVPRFRQDTQSWDDFVGSWCESIAVEAEKNRTVSLVTKRIRSLLDVDGIKLTNMSSPKLACFLRDNWEVEWGGEGETLGELIVNYHEHR